MMLVRTEIGLAYHPLIADKYDLREGKRYWLFLLPKHYARSAMMVAALNLTAFFAALGQFFLLNGGVEGGGLFRALAAFAPFYMIALFRFFLFRRVARLSENEFVIVGSASIALMIEWLTFFLALGGVTFLYGSSPNFFVQALTRTIAGVLIAVSLFPFFKASVAKWRRFAKN